MQKAEKKAAIAAYKERKTVAGVYAVRCSASGQVWVGRAPDLATIQNRVWFTLRQGSHLDAELQAAWTAHGADNFTFEALESLDEEEIAYVRDAALKKSLARWQTELKAQILP